MAGPDHGIENVLKQDVGFSISGINADLGVRVFPAGPDRLIQGEPGGGLQS